MFIFDFFLQTDLEEAKAQEIAKLQGTLRDIQLQAEEAKAMVVKEREAARKAIEEAPPVINETPVLIEDTEKVNSLTTEVGQLKVWLQLNKLYSSHAIIFFYLVLPPYHKWMMFWTLTRSSRCNFDH